jgi:hypothetical protein
LVDQGTTKRRPLKFQKGEVKCTTLFSGRRCHTSIERFGWGAMEWIPSCKETHAIFSSAFHDEGACLFRIPPSNEQNAGLP